MAKAKTKALTANVWVSDDDGVPHYFAAGDKPPAWAAAKITNPNAWGEESEASDGDDTEE